MRIDSSGRLLVGKTSTSFNTAGVEAAEDINGDGWALWATSDHSNTSDGTVALNRNSYDGDILRFHKDGSSVGGIGTDSTDIYIGTTDTGIRFNDAVNGVLPYNTSSGQTDNTLDLGFSSVRWKDLYLSGGVYLGGTGSANYLDDYEEGTWAPSFQSDGSTSYAVRVGTYTKVGNLVTAWFHLDINSNGATSTQSLIIAGLPFAAINTSENYGSTGGLHCNQWSTSTKPDNALVSPGANVANVYKSNGQTGIQVPTHADIGGGNMVGFLIYRAT